MVDSNPRTHDFCDRLKARLLGTVSSSKTRACRGWKCYGGLSCQTPLMQVTQMPQNAPRNGCGRKVRRALLRRWRKVRASQLLKETRQFSPPRGRAATTAAAPQRLQRVEGLYPQHMRCEQASRNRDQEAAQTRFCD